MKIEGVSLDNLRTRKSAKWTGFPADVLPMPVAEMDFEIAAPIRELLIEMITNSDTGYIGETGHLGRYFASFAQSEWGWSIDSEQLFLCADVGVGMIEMARTVVQPGDRIMINSPIYLTMFKWIEELKCTAFDAPMHKEGMKYTLDLATIEEGYNSGIKLHFICNPQNPTGSVHSREDLAAIADLAKQYGVYVFSDEIHAPLVYKEEKFTPFLSVNDNAREVGICVTAASKAWNLAGLKCAFILTQSERMAALAKSMPQSVRYRASLLGAHATAEAYNCTDWLEGVMETLDANRTFVQEQLASKLPMANYRIPNCSYLAWIDLSAYELGENPSEILLEHGRIALTPGYLFGDGCTQYVRLNFATSQEIIAEGIDRIVATVNRAK